MSPAATNTAQPLNPGSATPPRSADGDEFWIGIADRLRRFIHRRVGDAHTAEDLVQEVLVRAQANLKSAPMDNLPAWLFQIARNLLINHYRARQVRKAVPLDDEPAEAEADRAVVAELGGCIRPMLARLPEPYRQALEQTDLGDKTQAQLAEDLGLSLPGAKSRVQRAREQLRDVLMSCCAVRTGPDGTIDHGCECGPPDYCSGRKGKC